MGLPMAPQEADIYPPQVPTLRLSNGSRTATWMMCQSNQTKSNISRNDFNYFNAHGAFPPRSVFPSTPIILRLHIHNASTSHLFPGIPRPHFDIHPLSAKTLPELSAVLVQQIPNISLSHMTLSMEDRANITLCPPFEMEVQPQTQAQNQRNTISNEEVYMNWWKAQFVCGRAGVTAVRVIDNSPA